jgi:hypothetical protein
MSWNSAKKAVAKDAGGGLFVKLSLDGARIRFVPVTEPKLRWIEWRGGMPFDVEPDSTGKDVQKSYVFQVFDLEARRLRVMDLRHKPFREVADQIAKHGVGHVYQLVRRGVGKRTDWVCTEIQEVPGELAKAIRAEGELVLDLKLYPLPDEEEPGAPGGTIGRHPGDGYRDYTQGPAIGYGQDGPIWRRDPSNGPPPIPPGEEDVPF